MSTVRRNAPEVNKLGHASLWHGRCKVMGNKEVTDMTSKRILTIDIETLPAADKDRVYLNEAEREDPALAEEAVKKTSLSGDFGRLLCIAYSDERPDGRRMGFIGWDKEANCLHGSEQVMLREFWDLMANFNPSRDLIVGHNIMEFDLKFIIKRSIINRVRPTVRLSFAKYRSQPIFDTMCEWECWGFPGKIGLDKLAHVLSLKTSKTDEVNGGLVAPLFEAGRHQEIRDYCLADVRLTREIFKRMTFTTDEEVKPVERTVDLSVALEA